MIGTVPGMSPLAAAPAEPVTSVSSARTALRSVSLEDSMRAALARSEAFAIETEALAQTEERHRQARGSVLPALNASATQTWQEQPSSSFGSSIFPSVQPVLKLSATQPLFRGLREFAGIRAAEDQVRAQREKRRLVESQVYLELVQNFYSILSIERELRNVGTQIELHGKRVGELRARRQIGRSRLSEELSTEAAMGALKAQAEILSGQLRALRENFASITGLEPHAALQDPQESSFAEGSFPLPLEEYLKGVEARPDVSAERHRLEAAEEAVRIARGAHLPSADLGGNYYFVRSGSLKDVTWDLQLGVSLPLYAGGVLQSRVTEARSQLRQAELALARARRIGEQEIRALYEVVSADRRQIKALQESVRLSERNYVAQSQDYRNGTVSNLEVLQALTSFQESRRALDRARFASKQDFLRLEIAAGRKPRREQGEREE
ncbi:MAG: TolC family protein [Oligoflexia bacterium]|nr:TolC family protein [Oligoflexia bacterium]